MLTLRDIVPFAIDINDKARLTDQDIPVTANKPRFIIIRTGLWNWLVQKFNALLDWRI